MQSGEDSLINEDDGQPFVDALKDWQDQDDEERDEGAEDDYYEDFDHLIGLLTEKLKILMSSE